MKTPISFVGALPLLFLLGCSGRGDRAQARAAIAPDSTSVHALVTQVLAAYGGEAALSAIHAYRAEGPLTAVQENKEAQVVRWFERPDRLRIEIRYPDKGELRITAGTRGWAGSDDRHLEPVEGSFLQSMRLQTVRLDLPIRLSEHESELSFQPDDDQGRRVLRLPLEGGLTVDYHVDPGSGHIEHTTMTMPGPPSISFESELSDFRYVHGVLFPYREDTAAGGTKTAVMRFESVDLNPVVPPALFSPEAGS